MLTVEVHADTAELFSPYQLAKIANADRLEFVQPQTNVTALGAIFQPDIKRPDKVLHDINLSTRLITRLQQHSVNLFDLKVDSENRVALSILLEALFLGIVQPVHNIPPYFKISLVAHYNLLSNTEITSTAFIVHKMIEAVTIPTTPIFANYMRAVIFPVKLHKQDHAKLLELAPMIFTQYPCAPESIALDYAMLNYTPDYSISHV